MNVLQSRDVGPVLQNLPVCRYGRIGIVFVQHGFIVTRPADISPATASQNDAISGTIRGRDGV